MDVRQELHRLGGVADRATLVALTSRADVEGALRSGAIVRIARGRYGLPIVDEGRRIVLEADSFAWHGDLSALRWDARRYDNLVVRGWLVLRFAWGTSCTTRTTSAIPSRRSATSYTDRQKYVRRWCATLEPSRPGHFCLSVYDEPQASTDSSAATLRVLFGSTGTPGPMVVETVTFLRYRPLELAGLSRSTSSSAAA